MTKSPRQLDFLNFIQSDLHFFYNLTFQLSHLYFLNKSHNTASFEGGFTGLIGSMSILVLYSFSISVFQQKAAHKTNPIHPTSFSTDGQRPLRIVRASLW